MTSHGSMLLTLYHGARVMPPAEFAEFALGLMKSLVRFEKARFTTAELDGEGIVLRSVVLHNEPSGMALDWAAIATHDKVVHIARDHLGQVLNYHARSLFDQAVMLDYADRYEHRNGLVIMRYDEPSGLHDGMALYRVRDADHFNAAEQRLMALLAPHVQEAMRINGQQAGAQDAQRGDLAIAGIDGAVQFCGPGFCALARLEWPDWRPQRLPAALLGALTTPGGRYVGKHVIVSCAVQERWLYLRARRHYKVGQLSPRELEVARAYASGLSSKQVAQQLGLAPATVRSFLQKVYQKLDIGDKAQLANVISACAAQPGGHA